MDAWRCRTCRSVVPAPWAVTEHGTSSLNLGYLMIVSKINFLPEANRSWHCHLLTGTWELMSHFLPPDRGSVKLSTVMGVHSCLRRNDINMGLLKSGQPLQAHTGRLHSMYLENFRPQLKRAWIPKVFPEPSPKSVRGQQTIYASKRTCFLCHFTGSREWLCVM